MMRLDHGSLLDFLLLSSCAIYYANTCFWKAQQWRNSFCVILASRISERAQRSLVEYLWNKPKSICFWLRAPFICAGLWYWSLRYISFFSFHRFYSFLHYKSITQSSALKIKNLYSTNEYQNNSIFIHLNKMLFHLLNQRIYFQVHNNSH